MKNKTELLAPAGSFQVMKACIAAGADAVYMGLPRFSARAFAENAGTEDYVSAIHYAHLHGKKLYLTLNTLLKEKEMEEELRLLLDPLYAEGLDGIIVQDLGLMQRIGAEYPELPLHVSTQAAVTGPGAANMLKNLGASRVVPARELSLREIKKIKEESGLEVECFIHGALCYAYSGQCLFSSLVGGRSGNRGRCAQSCRMEYDLFTADGQKLNERNETYLLSLKDLNTLTQLPALLAAGVDSLKIEGRMKKAEYAAGVTAVYRKYLDLFYEKGPENYRVDPKDQKILFDLFNRQGFTDGYLHRHNGKDMLTLKKPAFREENEALFEEIRKKYLKKEHHTPVSMQYRFGAQEEGTLQISTRLDGREFTASAATGAPAEEAKNRAAAAEDVEKQLRKLGDTDFFPEKLQGEISGSLFLPVSILNELRRSAVQALQEEIIRSYRRSLPERTQEKNCEKLPGRAAGAEAFDLQVLCSTNVQFQEALQSDASTIIIESDLCAAGSFTDAATRCRAANKAFFIALPQILREERRQWLLKAVPEIRRAAPDGFLVRNLEELWILSEEDIPGERISDYTLYCFNKRSRDCLESLGIEKTTASQELSMHEIPDSVRDGDTILLYGYLPMMISANCVLKSTAGCDKKHRTLYLRDRMNHLLPVQCRCDFCENRILNAVPLSLLGLRNEVAGTGLSTGRLDFTVESAEETRAVLEAFSKAYLRRQSVPELSAFTRGHFKRKVD